MKPDELAVHVEIVWLEAERYMNHVRFYELKSNDPDTRHIAFAKCRRLEIYVADIESIARELNRRVNMNDVRRLSQNGDRLDMSTIQSRCETLVIMYRWHRVCWKLSQNL